MDTVEPQTTPDPRRWWALALLCGAFFMVILDAAIVTVALPSIQRDLGFSEQSLQWVVSAYALTFAGLLLLGGRAADLLGRRRVFMFGLVVFTAASLLCGLAWSPAALIGARALQGVGAAIMTPTALSIIMTTFEEGRERNKALGIWGSLGGVGATAAWLIGGVLVDGPGWQWIFFINIPVGIAALALSPVLLKESRAETAERSFDPAGALTVTGALVSLVYAVVEAPTQGVGERADDRPPRSSPPFFSSRSCSSSAASGLPLVPLSIFRSRTLVGANSVMLFFGAVVYGMPFILTLYTQQVLGYSAVKFGLTSIVFPIAAAVGSISGQAIVLRIGFRPVAAVGMALMSLGSLLLTQVSVDGTYFGDVFFGLLVFGPGVGLAFVTASIAALAGVPEKEAGLASGLSNTSFQIGAALGVAAVATVSVTRTKDFFAANGHADPLLALTNGFQSAFLACCSHRRRRHGRRARSPRPSANCRRAPTRSGGGRRLISPEIRRPGREPRAQRAGRHPGLRPATRAGLLLQEIDELCERLGRSGQRLDLLVRDLGKVRADNGAEPSAVIRQGGAPATCQVDEDHASVTGLAGPSHQSLLFELLDDDRDRRLRQALELGELGDSPRARGEGPEQADLGSREVSAELSDEQPGEQGRSGQQLARDVIDLLGARGRRC